MSARYTDDQVLQAMVAFVQESADLRGSTYAKLSPIRGWPSHSVAGKRLGGGSFDDAVWRVVVEHGRPEFVYRWSRCRNGFKHSSPTSEIFETIGERRARECGDCAAAIARREAWKLAQPTFRELYPDAVQWLSNLDEAGTRGELVAFRCSACDRYVRWSPSTGGVPKCHYCRTVGDAQPGELIDRRGGGDRVHIEFDVAAALRDHHGIETLSTKGVVIPKGSIMVAGLLSDSYPLPAIKPDLILPDGQVAVELDFDGRHYSHGDQRNVDQDRARDAILGDLGWRVLRVRPPGLPRYGTWPWSVETTSRSPRILAQLIVRAIDEVSTRGLTRIDARS